ncbi:MAG: 50S ribosomal protein L10 [Elusimicrobia bacterium]|nr:50S ribosomal protein L10 [Elusimicrobiota bacterium]
MNEQEKKLALEELAAVLSKSPISLFASFKGVTTPELFEAKKKIKKENAKFCVIKKSLLEKAFQNIGLEISGEQFWKGEVAAMTCSNGDPSRLAKLLAQWAEQNKNIVIKGGVILSGKKWLDRASVERLAKLPCAKELQAQLVGGLAAPMAHLAGVLNATLVRFLLVLKAVEANKKEY